VKEKVRKTIAEYVGLRVQVIAQMDHCSMICFKGRRFIVDTADLSFVVAFEQAA
jgi:hypothetical protein